MNSVGHIQQDYNKIDNRTTSSLQKYYKTNEAVDTIIWYNKSWKQYNI